nr:hypothetical protein [Xanthomonas translucens]
MPLQKRRINPAVALKQGRMIAAHERHGVAMTEAGERLFDTLAPRLQEIDAELGAIADFRDRPACTIRITTVGHAADAYVWPKLTQVLPHYGADRGLRGGRLGASDGCL